ncbi:MAG: 30S ribosomal protein S14 [Gammaproteobacteria bacterium]
MAKTSMINREVKRLRLVQKHRTKRADLLGKIRNRQVGRAEREETQRQLQRLPRDASPSRMHNRCRITGRPHGFYRKFGLARNKLRAAAMNGDIPGLVKASW